MGKTQIGVWVDEGTKEEIESRLGYNDSLSEWVRVAIEERLEREDEVGNRSPADRVLAD